MLAVGRHNLETREEQAGARGRVEYVHAAGEMTGLADSSMDLVSLSLTSHELPAEATRCACFICVLFFFSYIPCIFSVCFFRLYFFPRLYFVSCRYVSFLFSRLCFIGLVSFFFSVVVLSFFFFAVVHTLYASVSVPARIQIGEGCCFVFKDHQNYPETAHLTIWL